MTVMIRFVCPGIDPTGSRGIKMDIRTGEQGAEAVVEECEG